MLVDRRVAVIVPSSALPISTSPTPAKLMRTQAVVVTKAKLKLWWAWRNRSLAIIISIVESEWVIGWLFRDFVEPKLYTSSVKQNA
jgi:hypothetical protein